MGAADLQQLGGLRDGEERGKVIEHDMSPCCVEQRRTIFALRDTVVKHNNT